MLWIIETIEHESFPFRLIIRYFHAIQFRREDRPAAAVAEAATAYEPERPFAWGRAFKIRQRVLEEFPSGRRAADAEELPDRNKTRWAVGVPGSWAPEQMGEDEALS